MKCLCNAFLNQRGTIFLMVQEAWGRSLLEVMTVLAAQHSQVRTMLLRPGAAMGWGGHVISEPHWQPREPSASVLGNIGCCYVIHNHSIVSSFCSWQGRQFILDKPKFEPCSGYVALGVLLKLLGLNLLICALVIYKKTLFIRLFWRLDEMKPIK